MTPLSAFLAVFAGCFCVLLANRLVSEFAYELWKRERERDS